MTRTATSEVRDEAQGPAGRPTSRRRRTDEAGKTARRLAWLEGAGLAAVFLAAAGLLALLVAYYSLVPSFEAAQWELDQYPGQVLSVTDGSDEYDSGWVTVRFGRNSDDVHRARISVGDVDRYSVGEPVTVLVDPESDLVTLPGENFTPRWFEDLALAVGIVAVALGAAGWWVFARVHPVARALRRSSWHRVSVRWGVAPLGPKRTHRGVLYAPELADDLVWTVSGGGQLRRTDEPFALEVAGDRRGLAVRRPGTHWAAHASPHPWPVVEP